VDKFNRESMTKPKEPGIGTEITGTEHRTEFFGSGSFGSGSRFTEELSPLANNKPKLQTLGPKLPSRTTSMIHSVPKSQPHRCHHAQPRPQVPILPPPDLASARRRRHPFLGQRPSPPHPFLGQRPPPPSSRLPPPLASLPPLPFYPRCRFRK